MKARTARKWLRSQGRLQLYQGLKKYRDALLKLPARPPTPPCSASPISLLSAQGKSSEPLRQKETTDRGRDRQNKIPWSREFPSAASSGSARGRAGAESYCFLSF